MTLVSTLILVASFLTGLIGTIVGAVLASFRIDKRIALLEAVINADVALIEQKISLLIDGPAGLLVRMGNLESAINARKIGSQQ